MNLGALFAELGRIASALEHFAARLSFSREFGDRRGMTAAMINLGQTFHACGSFAESRAQLTRALSLSRELGVRYYETYALQLLAELDADDGDAAAAERGFGEAIALRRQIGQKHGEAATLVARGALFARQGRESEARTDLVAALAALATHEGRAGVQNAMHARFLVWKATGDRAHLEEARRRLDYLVAHAPPAHRESMATNVRLHREIAAAAAAAGIPAAAGP